MAIILVYECFVFNELSVILAALAYVAVEFHLPLCQPVAAGVDYKGIRHAFEP